MGASLPQLFCSDSKTCVEGVKWYPAGKKEVLVDRKQELGDSPVPSGPVS
ncbi:hypothetical protein PVAP13_5NG211881 [Panicum virgatum]|uniref:Uncharacterized protein n=1 Tax=Panicum virgatum TaxID=38727 RepID=A0A8T0RS81_PANVG|nr:hypothetical protein PVAP13_5NG211881 [Panicum virgatum]